MKEEGVRDKRVVVFFGLVASGKSFVAKAWAHKHQFPYYNTDVVRKGLAGIRATDARPEARDEGIYSKAFSRLTYDALVDLALHDLADPAVSWVVLDGSYHARAERDRVRARFDGLARVVFILCSCGEDVTKTRLAKRAADPAAVSDGRWEIYLQQKENFEEPEELPSWQLNRLDTNKEVDSLLTFLDCLLLQGRNGREI
ncbi:MAG: AAA family ATPase [Desulforhopalus sp.]|nr:AAA family ATPase [Desulforhopalus sp.]